MNYFIFEKKFCKLCNLAQLFRLCFAFIIGLSLFLLPCATDAQTEVNDSDTEGFEQARTDLMKTLEDLNSAHRAAQVRMKEVIQGLKEQAQRDSGRIQKLEKDLETAKKELISSQNRREAELVALRSTVEDLRAMLAEAKEQAAQDAQKIASLQSAMTEAKAKADQCAEKLNKVSADYNASSDKLDEALAENERLKTRSAQIEKSLKESESARLTLESEIKSLSSKIKEFEDKAADDSRKLVGLQSDLLEKRNALKSLRSEYNNAVKEKSTLSAQLEKERDSVAQLEGEKREVTDILGKTEQELESVRNDLDEKSKELEAKIKDVTSRLEKSVKEKELLSEEKDIARKELKVARDDLESAMESLATLRESSKEVQERLTSTVDELKKEAEKDTELIHDLRKDLQTAEKDHARYKSLYDEEKTRVTRISSEMSSLQKELESWKKMHKQLKQSNSAMEEKLNGAIAQLKAQIKKDAAELSDVKSQLAKAERNETKINDDYLTEKKRADELSRDLKKVEKAASVYKERYENVKDSAEKTEEQLGSMIEELKLQVEADSGEIEDLLDDLKKEQLRREKETSQLKKESGEFQSRAKSYKQEVAALSRSLKNARSSNRELADLARSKEREAESIRSMLGNCRKELDGQKKIYEVLKQSSSNIENELNELVAGYKTQAVDDVNTIQELERQVRDYEALIADAQSNQTLEAGDGVSPVVSDASINEGQGEGVVTMKTAGSSGSGNTELLKRQLDAVRQELDEYKKKFRQEQKNSLEMRRRMSLLDRQVAEDKTAGGESGETPVEKEAVDIAETKAIEAEDKSVYEGEIQKLKKALENTETELAQSKAMFKRYMDRTESFINSIGAD